MSDFKYADDKIAKIWLRSNVVVERHKDGTFKITMYMGEEIDEYAEDFCGRETYAYNEKHTPTVDAIVAMTKDAITKHYGGTTFVLADNYLPDGWEEPLTEADRQAQELENMAAELRSMLAE